MMSLQTTITLGLLAAANLVAGHAAITSATGDAGGSGMALGIDTTTPRDGTRRNPFQQDATRFRGDQEDTIGETVGAGDNNLEQGTQAILAETGDQLPQITAGGEVQMTLHQVNADGAGPYTCEINDDGTAQTWTNIQVTQSPPGDDSRDRDGEATDFPLTAAIPAGQECTGTVAGEDNVCLVRCMNGARAGPFGGVVPVQMANNATDNANANTNAGTDTDANANANTGNANTNTGADADTNTNTNTNGNSNTDTNTGSANGNANTNTNTGNTNSNANTGTATGNTANANTNTNTNTNAGTDADADTDTNTGSANGNTNTNTNTGNTNSNSANTNTNNSNADEEEEEEEEEEATNDRRGLPKSLKRSNSSFDIMLKRRPLLRL